MMVNGFGELYPFMAKIVRLVKHYNLPRYMRSMVLGLMYLQDWVTFVRPNVGEYTTTMEHMGFDHPMVHNKG